MTKNNSKFQEEAGAPLWLWLVSWPLAAGWTLGEAFGLAITTVFKLDQPRDSDFDASRKHDEDWQVSYLSNPGIYKEKFFNRWMPITFKVKKKSFTVYARLSAGRSKGDEVTMTLSTSNSKSAKFVKTYSLGKLKDDTNSVLSLRPKFRKAAVSYIKEMQKAAQIEGRETAAFKEEAKIVAPLVNILGGPIVNLIKKQIKNWMLGNEEKRTEAWKYFSNSWKRIPIRFRGKPYSFFIRIRHMGSHSLMDISTSLDHPIYSNSYDLPVIDKLEDNDFFYSYLRDSVKEFRRGLAKALKNGVTRKYKKMKKERLHKENSLPKKSKTVAAVETEEASIASVMIAGAIVLGIKKIFEARDNKKADKIRALNYFDVKWREIPVKHNGKVNVYYAKIMPDKAKNVHLVLSTAPRMQKALFVKQDISDVARNKVDVSNLEEFKKKFYRHLKAAAKKFERAVNDKRKSFKGEDRKKFDAQINGRRADMNTRPVVSASVTDRLNAIALYLDPEQLKWQCADFGHVSVDDYGSDEQTIIITRHRQAGNVAGFIYVTTEKDGRKATFKATNSKFAAECHGVVINTIDDMSEKLRAFEHMITSLGRHLQNYAAGMPVNPRPGEMKEYKEANRRKIPEVQKMSTSRGTAVLVVTSPFLPDTSLQIFNASPKALEKAASSMSLF